MPASPTPSRLRHYGREAAQLALTLLLLAAARSSFANHYHVPSGSMEPTLRPGDRVAVDMRAYGLRLPFTSVELVDGDAPRSGDVVVFDSPADGERLVKRVVAVGGDRVALHDGRLTVNGRPAQVSGWPVVERFPAADAELDLGRGGGPDLPPTRVPAGHVLVLGDHRGNSVDGRAFGWVRADALYGRAVAVYYRRGEGLGWWRLRTRIE
ncbi:MAG TPA: signal peptidase I [Lysobacter sp.]|nr:signal peptidase I [Lysobacter sp.]